MPPLEEFFSHVCGQEHVWDLGGQLLPFCQRCTGLYVSGAPVLFLFGIFRPRPSLVVLSVHGFLLLLMVPFGYHLVPQGAVVRTLTGQLFAVGMLYFLALIPAARMNFWGKTRRSSVRLYATGVFVSIVALQFAVHTGGPPTAMALTGLGVAGLVTYAALAVATVALLPRAVWRVVRRSSTTS
jgi:hypothetical protein